MIIVFSSPPFCTNHVSPQNSTIQNSGHILKMQLVSHFPSASPPYHRPFYQDCKRSVTQNCLFAYSFAFKIIYVLTSQKDTAADVLQKGLLLLLEGKYLLGDAGFSASPKLLTPYQGVRYHLAEWGRAHLRFLFILFYFNPLIN